MNNYLEKNRNLIFFGLTTTILLIFLYFLPKLTFLEPYTRDFNGNIAGEIIGGVLFLFLALHLQKESDERLRQVDDRLLKVDSSIETMEKIVIEREEMLRREKEIFRFKQFLENEAYHNIRFPDLVFSEGSLGLEYTIEPCRSDLNHPLVRSSEFENLYLIKIRDIAFRNVMNKEDFIEYESSPIHLGEYYFCSYYNGSWHMSLESGAAKDYKFYLSGKSGEGEYGTSANEFVNAHYVPENYQKLFTLRIGRNGEITKSSFTPYDIYSDEDQNLYLQIWRSPLKKIYYTTRNGTHDVPPTWILSIENFHGYGDQNFRHSIKSHIESELNQRQIVIKKLPWYNVDEKQRII